MNKTIFLLVIVLALAIGMAVPTGSAAAVSAKQVNFTATSTSLCPGDPRCNDGVWEPQQSGKMLITGFVDVMDFQASDPRWNAVCVFSAGPLLWGASNGVPIMGTFVCTATDPAYQGGQWKGTLQQVAHPQTGGWMAVWSAKGYGTFDGLLTTVYNNYSSKYVGVPFEINNVGVINELPKYQP